MPGLARQAFHSPSFDLTTLADRYSHLHHFTYEEAEVQKGSVAD